MYLLRMFNIFPYFSTLLRLVSSEWFEVNEFGHNPTNLSLAVYMPQDTLPKPATLLTLHGCGGDGPTYASWLGYTALADDRGFIVLAPSTTRDHNVRTLT